MPYQFSSEGVALHEQVRRYMEAFVYPNEELYYRELETSPDGHPPVMDKLKAAAMERGLWNLFLPGLDKDHLSTPLSNVDYAPVSEMLGKVGFASEALNCSAPDTGNMEILHRYGTEAVKRRWLEPLLAGETRSAFSMTEPDVASSDATNIGLRIERTAGGYVLNGRKWFSSGAASARCQVLVVMGVTDPEASPHRRQSMVVVPPRTPPACRSACYRRSSATRITAATPRWYTRTCGFRPTTSWGTRGAASPSPRRASDPGASITACGASGWPSGPWI